MLTPQLIPNANKKIIQNIWMMCTFNGKMQMNSE